MNILKIIIGFIVILGISSCSYLANSNQLDSDEYETKEERIKVLKQEINSFSNFENAEFELFNVNGFSNSSTTIPGASSWNYKFAIKVDSLDIDKWTTGMSKTKPENHDDQWMNKLIQERKEEWKTNSKPEFYTRIGEDVMLVVFRRDRIIFKSIVNL